jgi:hypothetical protein
VASEVQLRAPIAINIRSPPQLSRLEPMPLVLVERIARFPT